MLNLIAPAASGKTTLLIEWSRAHPEMAVAHLSLDLLDNEVSWFWSRIVAALQDAGAPVRGTTAELTSLADGTALTHSLLADLVDLAPTVLILDDLQNLSDSATADLLNQLLLNLPASLRVILSSRTHPPLHEGLLRARGHLAELPAGELCFDRAEMEAVLASFGTPLERRDITRLHERTEGWTGGVMLAAVSLTDHPDPQGFVEAFSGSNRFLVDLFQRDVLADLPPELQDFLLITSVLDTFDAALCDAVTGHTDGAAALDRLRRTGMFLEPVLDQPTYFRYQQLFRQFLQHQLHLLDPEAERSAHHAAAEWYEANDDVTAALHHLLAADAAADAARLVLRHAEHYASSGSLGTLRSCLKALPHKALTGNPDLLIEIINLCVLTGMRDDARTGIQRSLWRLSGHDDPRASAQLAIASARVAWFAANLESAIDNIHRALALLEQLDERDAAAEADARLGLAASYAILDHVAPARRHLDASEAPADTYLLPAVVDGWLSYREGQLDRALDHAEAVLQSTQMPWFRVSAHLARGGVQRERNELATAEAELLTAAELATRLALPTIEVIASIELGCLRFAQGRPGDAYDHLTSARTNTEGRLLRQRVDVLEATLWLLLGDIERAESLRQRLPGGTVTAALDVRLALANDDVNRASQLVTSLSADAGSLRERIQAALLQARVELASDTAGAMGSLRHAIALGREQRVIRQFTLDLPELQLAMRQLAAERDDPYLFDLLAATAERPGPDARPSSVANALSTRELAILRYLPTPLSNKEIAAELHVSVNTLKTHLKNINRKLGTGSRSDTIAAARSLTLL